MNKFIGIGHKKQSGKNTVAKMLQYYFFKNASLFKISLEDWLSNPDPKVSLNHWRIRSFASPIKQKLSLVWNVREDMFESEEFKNSEHPNLPGVTWRELLIALGEGMRKADPEYWIEAENQNLMPTNNYIFTDVRRYNEAAYIKSKGGILIHVNRPGISRGSDQPEVELDNFNGWNIQLDNSKDISYLYDQLTTKIKQWNF